MENQSQRIQVITHKIYPPERPLPSSQYQPNHHTPNRINKIPRAHLDCRLNWKEHITKNRKQIDLKVKEVNWLTGKKSPLSIENKLLVYKAIINQYGAM